MKKYLLTILCTLPLSLPCAGMASAMEHALDDATPPYPLVQEGADLAEMWCNACHVTGTGTTEEAMDAAPPFATLAPAVAANPEFYRGFLTNPHDPMREISLSRNEIQALLAYIQSLEE